LTFRNVVPQILMSNRRNDSVNCQNKFGVRNRAESYRIDISLASVFQALANPYARTLDLEFEMGTALSDSSALIGVELLMGEPRRHRLLTRHPPLKLIGEIKCVSAIDRL